MTFLRDKIPGGFGDYEVRHGDCLYSIAAAHGFHWGTLWLHPANAQLKSMRANPKCLLPGDRVVLPRKRVKSVRLAIDQDHALERASVNVRLKLKLLRDGVARADEAYMLVLPNGEERRGTLDGEGALDEKVDARFKTATLYLGEGWEDSGDDPGAEDETNEENGDSEDEAFDVFELDLGGLDPATTASGLQARLKNRGFEPGPLDGRIGPRTAEAVRRFQASSGLEANAALNDGTVGALTDGEE